MQIQFHQLPIPSLIYIKLSLNISFPNKTSLCLSNMALPLILLSILSIFLAYKLFQRLRFKLPPGPRPLPIVGNLYDIKPVRFRCFAEWAQAYGPIISVWFGSTLNVIVSNSELAKEVLKENDQQLADRHRSRSAAKFSRDGKDLIWADYGPHYVKVRKVCTLELFTPKRLEALRPIREDEVTAMVESIFKDCTDPQINGKNLLIRKYLGAVAFNNITRLAFGKRFVNSEGVMDEQGLEFKAVVANGLKLGASLAMAEHIPWLRWMFPLEEEAFAKHGARRDRLTRAIMEEHTLARKQSGGAKQHFVDALLTLQEKYDLSEDTIIGLLWVCTFNFNFSFILAKEALRLHPPTPLMLPHRANANVKVGGYDIPKGSNVHVNVWAVARDPAVWKDPLDFRPERFFEEDVDMKGHDYRLLPFGAGKEVKAEEIDMSENPGLVTYMKTPIQAVPTPRLPSHLYKRVAVDM
ncbi:hypothetical protein Patl1_21093 [Pistacia atlantica]|uniref:Uncharacterized protein n=1 Tax=Pistacia atlantica TaxID=434234 RepID=A0ACC1BNF9_9ROSI|nr:hypothetical protein Patl1_21093 [Pistacia atlantica]